MTTELSKQYINDRKIDIFSNVLYHIVEIRNIYETLLDDPIRHSIPQEVKLLNDLVHYCSRFNADAYYIGANPNKSAKSKKDKLIKVQEQEIKEIKSNLLLCTKALDYDMVTIRKKNLLIKDILKWKPVRNIHYESLKIHLQEYMKGLDFKFLSSKIIGESDALTTDTFINTVEIPYIKELIETIEADLQLMMNNESVIFSVTGTDIYESNICKHNRMACMKVVNLLKSRLSSYSNKLYSPLDVTTYINDEYVEFIERVKKSIQVALYSIEENIVRINPRVTELSELDKEPIDLGAMTPRQLAGLDLSTVESHLIVPILPTHDFKKVRSHTDNFNNAYEFYIEENRHKRWMPIQIYGKYYVEKSGFLMYLDMATGLFIPLVESGRLYRILL